MRIIDFLDTLTHTQRDTHSLTLSHTSVLTLAPPCARTVSSQRPSLRRVWSHHMAWEEALQGERAGTRPCAHEGWRCVHEWRQEGESW